MKYVVGIDEAGRGPLAGPVAIAAVVMPAGAKSKASKVRDSKKLNYKQREEIYSGLKLKFVCSLVGEKIIDKLGIVRAVRIGIKRCLKRLNFAPACCRILLDGSLKAPARYRNQKTIIKGDERVQIIALSSIVAKVRRDRRMIKLSQKYPAYDFHVNKGYGTRAHYRALKKHGPSPIHRRSFL